MGAIFDLLSLNFFGINSKIKTKQSGIKYAARRNAGNPRHPYLFLRDDHHDAA